MINGTKRKLGKQEILPLSMTLLCPLSFPYSLSPNICEDENK